MGVLLSMTSSQSGWVRILAKTATYTLVSEEDPRGAGCGIWPQLLLVQWCAGQAFGVGGCKVWPAVAGALMYVG